MGRNQVHVCVCALVLVLQIMLFVHFFDSITYDAVSAFKSRNLKIL